MSEWVDVASVTEISPGERKCLDVGEHRVIVVNLEGSFYAVHNLCTHAYFELDDSPIEKGAILCPLHGAQFCLKTGEVLSPPAFENLMTFPVRVQNNTVQVCVEPNDT